MRTYFLTQPSAPSHRFHRNLSLFQGSTCRCFGSRPSARARPSRWATRAATSAPSSRRSRRRWRRRWRPRSTPARAPPWPTPPSAPPPPSHSLPPTSSQLTSHSPRAFQIIHDLIYSVSELSFIICINRKMIVHIQSGAACLSLSCYFAVNLSRPSETE